MYDNTISVKRMAVVSGNKKTFSEVLADVDAHIQPLDSEFTENTSYILGKDFQMFCGIIDLREGDRIVADSKEYKVIAVEKYDSPLLNTADSHIEAIIRIFDNI